MLQTPLAAEQPSVERRTDFLSATIVNLAIDMEANLGAVQAIVYMRRNNVNMAVALRVVLKAAERRKVTAWEDSPPPQDYDLAIR
jgi:hypothetical protein